MNVTVEIDESLLPELYRQAQWLNLTADRFGFRSLTDLERVGVRAVRAAILAGWRPRKTTKGEPHELPRGAAEQVGPTR